MSDNDLHLRMYLRAVERHHEMNDAILTRIAEGGDAGDVVSEIVAWLVQLRIVDYVDIKPDPERLLYDTRYVYCLRFLFACMAYVGHRNVRRLRQHVEGSVCLADCSEMHTYGQGCLLEGS